MAPAVARWGNGTNLHAGDRDARAVMLLAALLLAAALSDKRCPHFIPEHDDACERPVRHACDPRGDDARLHLGLGTRVTATRLNYTYTHTCTQTQITQVARVRSAVALHLHGGSAGTVVEQNSSEGSG